MKRWRERIRKTAVGAVFSGIAVFHALSGCVYAEEVPMGRFVCEQAGFPELSDGEMAYDIVQTQAGALRLPTGGGQTGVTLWDSSDAGQTWQEAGRLPEEYGGLYYLSIALCEDGGGAALALDGEKQYYIPFDAQGNAKKIEQPEDANSWSLAFSQDGRVAAQSYSGELSVRDRETGEVEQTLGDIGVDAMAVCGEEVIAVAGKEVFRYDLNTGEPLARDEALEQALFDSGKTYEITTSFGRPVLFAGDGAGRIYYCTEKGIFSHIMEGSVVEQVIDGEMTALGDPSTQLLALEEADGSFYVLTMGNAGQTSLLRFTYSDDVQSVPPDTVTVYSLEENDTVHHAVSQFQIEHPDIYVEYQTGISAEDGVTVADAVRTLNTQILAGEGPDVLVLDGMPVDDYVEQGVLADISGILDEVSQSEGLLGNIVYAGQKEDGSVYAAPVQFSMVAVAGAPETAAQLGGEGSLENLRELSKEAGLLSWSSASCLAESLYPVYSMGWKQDDGTLNEALIGQYISLCTDVYQNVEANADASESELLQMYREYEETLKAEQTYYDDYPVSESKFDLARAKRKLSVGALGDMMDYISLLSIENEAEGCVFAFPEQEGGAVFVPYTMIGMSSTAKAGDHAQEFIRYLFGAGGIQASTYSRFPVNKALFDSILHPSEETVAQIEQTTYGEDSYESDDPVTIFCRWPSEEELNAFTDAVNGLSVCADMDRVQRDTVIAETKKSMYGICTEEEAVSSVMQKLNLYLAE